MFSAAGNINSSPVIKDILVLALQLGTKNDALSADIFDELVVLSNYFYSSCSHFILKNSKDISFKGRYFFKIFQIKKEDSCLDKNLDIIKSDWIHTDVTFCQTYALLDLYYSLEVHKIRKIVTLIRCVVLPYIIVFFCSITSSYNHPAVIKVNFTAHIYFEQFLMTTESISVRETGDIYKYIL